MWEELGAWSTTCWEMENLGETSAPGDGGTDLEKRLRAHSGRFASMVELIPAKFYIIKDESGDPDNGAGAQDSKYWVNKRKKKATKQAIKEVTKKAKRLKLDPEQQKSVAELQAEAQTGGEEGEGGGGDGGPSNAVNAGFSVERVQSTSLSDLQGRLKEKLASLRQDRKVPATGGSGEGGVSDKVARKRQKKAEKRTREKKLRKKKLGSGGSGRGMVSGARVEQTRPSIIDEATGRIVFSKFDFSTPVQAERKEEKPTGKRDYRKLLAKAEASQKKLEELKRNDERRGKELEKKLQWQKALDMARGTKLKDDPKLLKRTAKNLEKRKQKSSKAWEERKELEKQGQDKKQERRQRNIKNRADQVKAAKVKRRAKKGVTRKPGF